MRFLRIVPLLYVLATSAVIVSTVTEANAAKPCNTCQVPCQCCPAPACNSSACSPMPGVVGGESVILPGDTAVAPELATPMAAAPVVDNFPALAFNTQSSAFAGDLYAAADSKAGYIDTAMIRTMLRFRFDAAYEMDRPDRAEFFYTTWQAFGGQNPNPPEGFPDPDIDRQSVSLLYEHAFSRNFSAFVDVPFVFSDPLRNPNDQAFGDMTAGIKLSLLHNNCQQLTFQLKNYIPLHDSDEHWTGTGHYSIEPGILYYRQLNERWSLEAEVRDWISIGGAENGGDAYAGNVLRYGVGLGTTMGSIGDYSVKPIVEVVGWSVLEGQVFDFEDDQTDIGPVDAKGDTIVNLKLGARLAKCGGNSLYAGWGHSLTGDRWYRNIFRLELRKVF